MLSNRETKVNPVDVGGSASPQDPWKSVTLSFSSASLIAKSLG